MSGIGHNSDGASLDVLNRTAQTRLKTIVERVERLIEDREAVNADIKEVLAEAKGEGFDIPILRKVIKRRAQDKAKRQEEEALLDLYETAIDGMPAFEPLNPKPPAASTADDSDLA